MNKIINRGVRKPKVIRELTAAQKAEVARTPPKYKSMIEKAFSGKASLRLACKAKCAECNNFEDVADRSRDCHIETCPLWAYRPRR